MSVTSRSRCSSIAPVTKLADAYAGAEPPGQQISWQDRYINEIGDLGWPPVINVDTRQSFPSRVPRRLLDPHNHLPQPVEGSAHVQKPA